MKILLVSTLIGILLILLGKTGSELKKISHRSDIIMKDKDRLVGELAISNDENAEALKTIDNYHLALELNKQSTIALSKNLALREKLITDLKFRIKGQSEKYNELASQYANHRKDLLVINTNLKTKIKELECDLIKESKRMDSLKSQLVEMSESKKNTVIESNRLKFLYQRSNEKIADLEKSVSNLETENQIFIRTINSLRSNHYELSNSMNDEFGNPAFRTLMNRNNSQLNLLD